jgi:hypothetical protein
VNGFTGLLQTVTQINYNRFTDYRTLQITGAPAIPIPACCLHQSFPSNGFITSRCNCSRHEVFFAQPNDFLVSSSQSSSTAMSRNSLNCNSAGLESSLYSLRPDLTEITVSIVIAQQYFDCCIRIFDVGTCVSEVTKQ